MTINWTAPQTYTDGRPYGEADHGGYEVEVNASEGLFAVPVSWNVGGLYSYPIADLPGLKQGANAIRMRTVAANGEVSVWTDSVSFEYRSVPRPPTNLAVA
jgi:hypothetical protein